MYVYVGMCVPIMVYMWWSGDIFWHLAFSFYHLGVGDYTQMASLGSKHRHPSSNYWSPGWFFLECSPKVSLQLNRYPHTPSNSLWATENAQERTTFTNSNWIRGDMNKLPFTRARAWMTDQKKQFHSSLAWWTRVDWIVLSSQKLGWFSGSCITEKPSAPWAVT